MPCFIWIFAGVPYVEALRSNRSLSAALAAVGSVIPNLGVWFALHTLYRYVDTLRAGLEPKLELLWYGAVLT